MVALRFAAAVILGSLLAAAPAHAASQRYEGKVRNAGKVSFTVRSGKVSRFNALMSVSCVSAVAPSAGGIDVYDLAPKGTAKVSRSGAFSLSVDLPKQPIVGDDGKVIQTLYNVKGQVRGKLRGRKASGTAKVQYGKNVFTGTTIVVVSCSTGAEPIPWTAKRP